MKAVDIATYSLLNVLRKGRRSSLSILAVAVGIFSFCLVSGLGDEAAGQVDASIRETGLAGVMIYPQQEGLRLIDGAQLAGIAVREDVRGVTPFIYEEGVVSVHGRSQRAMLIGVDQDLKDVFDVKLLYGDHLRAGQVKGREEEALIDRELALTLFGRENAAGRTMTITIDGARRSFRVCGVVQSQKRGLESMTGVALPEIVYIPYTTLNELTGQRGVDRIAVSFFADVREESSAKEITRELSNANDTKYQYDNVSSRLEGLREAVAVVRRFVKLISAISLAVGGIGIMNCMLYSVDARRCDIGVCMSLGESRTSILMRFLTESLIQCLLGGTIGIVATVFCVLILNRLLSLEIVIASSAYRQSALLALLCGLLFGTLPAARASALDPVEAMRE